MSLRMRMVKESVRASKGSGRRGKDESNEAGVAGKVEEACV